MTQEDINDLLGKSPEAVINYNIRYDGYSSKRVKEIVSNLFYKYTNNFNQDILKDLEIMLKY